MRDTYFSDPRLPGHLPRFRLVHAPAGEFLMGSPDDDPEAFDSEKPRRPVKWVSWFDAAVFCSALSRLAGRDPAYLYPPSWKPARR